MRDEAVPTSPHEKFLLRINLDRRINFAIQQNDVPVVKSLHVENHSDIPLNDIRVRITAVPEFASPWETRIGSVPISSTYNVEKVNLVLSPQYLFELTEKVRGQLRFELLHGDECLFECMESVDLFCRDEWSGISSLPEILAAFILPNHPVVERILRDAADILGGWTGNSALSGYQTKDPKRVYTMAGAIYAAIQHLDLSYINPPASFEDEGQRIRLPDRIIESRMCTCLDLAVLNAACIEQAGLNPLIVLVKGHAIVGVWLHDQCFPEPAIDQSLRLSKRVDLDEIAVFDSTCVTNRPVLNFDAAAREAKRRLERAEEFVCVIDVARARKGQICPLPERVNRQDLGEATQAEAPKEAASAPDVSRLHTAMPAISSSNTEAQETGAIRLDRWRRRLLDLSLRNRLLNFRETKKTIPLLCPDLSALDDDLADGATFHILRRPHDLDENSPRNQEAYRSRTGNDAIEKLLREEFRAKRLRADLTQVDLDNRLLEIYRTARLQLEEGGASALYLAIGFLAWHETPESTERRLAPIILLPLDLHRKSVREGFTLRLGDDEPRLNMTLLELLRQDYDVVIHGLDPLPQDESGLDVRLILRTIREAIRDIDNWDVLETAEIGIFSFAKFLMWRDLAERASDLMKNSVVDHLVNHPHEEFQPGATFPDPDRLDEERPPFRTFCPLPADASQLAAVFAAADGRSFVLEGPPGTGKSQTITNLIAHCLAEDKRVLFVSEKMAALNVVHERLQMVGLGRYCLELHSNKADKREMLMQLNDALHQYQDQSSDEWEREARRLEGLRNELNAYVQALHKHRSTGETIFHATSHLIGLRNIPLVDLHWSSPDAIGANELALLRDLVDRLAITAAAVGEVPGHSWSAVHQPDWSPAWQQQVQRAIEQLTNALGAIEPKAVQVSSRFSLGESGLCFNELALMDELAGVLLDSPAPPVAILVRPDWEEIQDQIGKWIEHGHQRDLLRTNVFERFDEKVLSLDVGMLEQQLQLAYESSWPMSWWRCRRVHTALRNFAKDGKAPAKGELALVLRNVSALRDEEQALAAAGEQARALLGRFWKDGEADWKAVEGVRNWTRSFRSLSVRVAGDDFDRAAKLREHWSRIVTEGQDLLRKDAIIGRELLAYRSAYTTFRETKEIVDTLLDVESIALGVGLKVLTLWG